MQSGVNVCVCVCVITRRTQRHTKNKEMGSWMCRENVISRKRVVVRQRNMKQCVSSIVFFPGIILPPYVHAQNSMCCHSTVPPRPSVPRLFNPRHSHKLSRHAASRRHVQLWYEFTVWQCNQTWLSLLTSQRGVLGRELTYCTCNRADGVITEEKKCKKLTQDWSDRIPSILISFSSVQKYGVLSRIHVSTATHWLRFAAKRDCCSQD